MPSNDSEMAQVACVILGGGEGKRLYPLTEHCCKPAVPFGGKYRLIDIPISNTLHSGCHKIFILTQFLSSTLHQHIQRTYRIEPFSSGFLELLPAEQRHEHAAWYQGTADAVRQNLHYLLDVPVNYFLILSGDQLYRMDFQHLLKFAKSTDADLVVSTLSVPAELTNRMGILKIGKDQNIESFIEKPQSEDVITSFKLPDENTYLGSMGIYLFKKEALIKLLAQDLREDFGKHLIPTQIQNGKTFAYIHQGYWEDIGTIASFYEANMNLTLKKPLFCFQNDTHPIFSHPLFLSGTKIIDTKVQDSIICEGGHIEAIEIKGSILGPRSIIGKGCLIEDSYLIGNDFYTPPQTGRLPPCLKIEDDCIIRKAIIDKNVWIGKGVKLINKDRLKHYDGHHLFIRDGIIVVTRGATIPHGFVL